jgi:hypothetical protein
MGTSVHQDNRGIKVYPEQEEKEKREKRREQRVE